MRGLALTIVVLVGIVGTGHAQERGTIQATARVLPGDSAERNLIRRVVTRNTGGGTVPMTAGRYAKVRVLESADRGHEAGVSNRRRLVVYIEYLRN